ncbi:MAG TPA: RDD family protein [Vicinamibacterales bacterium]|jgi:uncharacterized RDD family membrane protein YckC
MTNPYAPPQAVVRDIVDPEAEVMPADRGTRLGAALLDGIVFGALVYVPALVGALATPRQSFGATPTLSALTVVLGLIGFCVWSFFTIRYVNANGQSIAKKMLGIRVIRTNGSPASLGRIFWLRNVVNGVISFIPLYGLVDVLFIFTESRRCLHDRIADTKVVIA